MKNKEQIMTNNTFQQPVRSKNINHMAATSQNINKEHLGVQAFDLLAGKPGSQQHPASNSFLIASRPGQTMINRKVDGLPSINSTHHPKSGQKAN